MSQSQKIVLVEDDDAVRDLMALCLKRAGFELSEVASANEALDLVTASPDEFGLVVTDVVLPGRTGPQLVQVLHQLNAELKVLYVSGYPGPDLDRFGVVPKDAVLRKPFELSDLVGKVRRLLSAGSSGAGLSDGS